MTENEAMEELRAFLQYDLTIMEEASIKTAIKSLEKQIPKKPKEKLVKVEIYNCGGFTETETRKICPVCKAGLVHETFCYNCGQKLDWNDWQEGK